jgi:hypothetical protein
VTTGSKLSDSLTSEGSESLVPYYDHRHRPHDIEVGDILKRPLTMESRKRAHRALEVAHQLSEKQRLLEERMELNSLENNKALLRAKSRAKITSKVDNTLIK